MPIEVTRSLERAFALLDCFTPEHPELGVREIARKVNLSSSTAGRLLAAMKELGILRQNPTTRAYALGGKVLAWAGVYSASLDVRTLALPALNELQRSTRETVSLYVLEGNERVCVERIESTLSIRFSYRLGQRLPLYAGAAGKAILAFLPPDWRAEILTNTPLQAFTNATLTSLDTLEAELAKIRQQGFAISYGEWTADAAGVAAPILDRQGVVQAAINISGPIQRFTPNAIERFSNEVVLVAARISLQLGYPPVHLIG